MLAKSLFCIHVTSPSLKQQENGKLNPGFWRQLWQTEQGLIPKEVDLFGFFISIVFFPLQSLTGFSPSYQSGVCDVIWIE